MADDASAAVQAAIAAAEAAAARGTTQAQLAYQLSQGILQEGQFEELPVLVGLTGTVLAESMAAYTAVAPAAKAADARVKELLAQAQARLRRKP
jgi:hypothetical protein